MRRREKPPECPECPPADAAPAAAGTLARTAATGEVMLPELVAWTSSFEPDRALLLADLVGSAVHVSMLGKTGLVPAADAAALRAELLAMFERAQRGELALPEGEEDVHMAIETELTRKLGDVELVRAPSVARRVADESSVHLLESVVEMSRQLRP